MLFTSPVFILGFLPLTLCGFFLLGRLGGAVWSLRFLLAADLTFYGWDGGNPGSARAGVHVLLLIASIAGNDAVGRRIAALSQVGQAARARAWLIFGITADLAVLAWFKYAGFLAGIAASVMGAAPPSLGIALPLAISFFTFQQILYLIENYRGDRAPGGRLIYATFVSFFAHLIAGPLVQPREIMTQLGRADMVRPRADNLAMGTSVFLLGLAKKLVLADTFAGFADIGFSAAASGASLTFVEAWYAVLCYALQIYFDFSGYCDMAVGLARLFNIRFPQNFNSPYKARNISDFWRRWHITLSQFLRDHVYIPLGGGQCPAPRRALNLMVTMLLGGLWHGAGWTFVLWGGLHGLYLIVHAQLGGFSWRRGRLARACGRLATLLAVLIAWVPFRADGLAATFGLWRGMAGLNGLALPQLVVHLLPALARIARAVPVLPHLGDARGLSFPEITACLLLGWTIVLALPNVAELTEMQRALAITGGFALTVQALFFAPGVAPFLYFRF